MRCILNKLYAYRIKRRKDTPIHESIIEIMKDVPDEELSRLPIDGASEHDHYIYGTPKKAGE